jgi:hypothetical protein
LSSVANPQITRRIELVAVPKFYAFSGALRVTDQFDGPGSGGKIDSYNSANPTNPNPSYPKVVNNDIPGAGVISYYGQNPSTLAYLADAHDGDVSVGTSTFAEVGPIWGDVTTNGGNVTHSVYQISGTIDNSVPFAIPPLKTPDTTGFATANGGADITAISTDPNAPTGFVYASLTAPVTIKNGNASDVLTPYAFAKIVVNGDITGKITVERGVTAQIFFTGNLRVKAGDLDNQNVDEGKPMAGSGDDYTVSRVAHMQFYGISPAAGVIQTIEITPSGMFTRLFMHRVLISA